MPNIEQTIILLPCYSLEDFQVSRNDDESEEILAGWCGLFHPVLLHRTQMLPRWERAYDPPLAPDQALIIIPECSEKNLPSTWLADLPADQVTVIRRFKDLPGLWQAIEQAAPGLLQGVPQDIVDDFIALGFAYLQVELMTRQLRYMSNLDEIRFRESALKAAAAAVMGKAEEAREQLQRGFDLLTESREYFYPVQAYLIDLTLTAETTLGAGLRRELESFQCVNLLTTGHLLRYMAEREPESLAVLKSVLAEGHVVTLGGEEDESVSAILPQPALLRSFRRGLNTWNEILETRPPIYGKRRFGLTPLLPGLLSHFRFEGALHFALDDGKFPVGNQSKLRWEGLDENDIDSVGRVPVDASRPATFLKLGETIGRMLDLDHAAAIIFAHWPSQVSPWYSVLKRVAQYSPVLGRFSSMTEYFRNTQYVGARVFHKPDEYRPPYLAQDVAGSSSWPISKWIRYVRQCAEADALAALAVIRGLITGVWDELSQKLCETAELGWQNADAVINERESTFDPQWPERASALRRNACDSLMALLPQSSAAFGETGVLWLNLSCVSARGYVCRQTGENCEKSSPEQLPKPATFPIPSFGYAWASSSYAVESAKQSQKLESWWRRLFGKASEKPSEEEWVIENETARLVVDKLTGGIQGIYPLPYGRNLLAQRLGMRLGSSMLDADTQDPEAEYSRMIAETIRYLPSTREEPAIQSEGRLVDRQGETIARFTQIVSAPAHLPFFRIRIQLEPRRMPDSNPWASYYACRFAWNDETATLSRSLGWSRTDTERERFESLYFNQVTGGHHTITLLCPGLPYHRMVGPRKLDTLLIVRGEEAKDFELGVGLDIRYPLHAALQLLQPPVLLSVATAPRVPQSAWWLTLDVRNVVVSSLQPVVEGHHLVGLRLALTETEGRAGPVTIQTCRTLSAAYRIDGLGEIVEPLALDGDSAHIQLGRFQTVEVELRFEAIRRE
ncbi:hypothetical protein [Thermogutta sp.]|uniref:hypothetical protein n=1 Tax=Thermogutta sp. TaxID=1962930 RepID=UPI0032205CB0